MIDGLDSISFAVAAVAGGLMIACAIVVRRRSAAWRHGVLAVMALAVTVGSGILAVNMRQMRDPYRVERLYRQIEADLRPLPSSMMCGTSAMIHSREIAMVEEEVRAVGVVAAVASGLVACGVMVLSALWARRGP